MAVPSSMRATSPRTRRRVDRSMAESVAEEGGAGNRGLRGLRGDVLCALALGLLGALVFSSALGAELVSDDKAIVPRFEGGVLVSGDARLTSLARFPDWFRSGLWESGLPSYRP